MDTLLKPETVIVKLSKSGVVAGLGLTGGQILKQKKELLYNEE